MLEPGSIVDGKFRIERVLGSGGMGIVAAATHIQLDQRVALKMLRDHLAANAELVERFTREARASAKLKNEHVCRVSDVGTTETGAPYIVMELLEGADLASVATNGPLPIDTVVDYVLQASIAIAEAHSLGIVHRDLKPGNLFLTRGFDGSPMIKVLDFGIAKAQSTTDFKITSTATILGSPGYMSPEQLRSTRNVDARTDIWALGVILYELVSGRLPFAGESMTDLAVKVSIDPPDPLTGFDPAFQAAVFRCLEKDPANRFQDVGQLAAALVPLGGASATTSAGLIAKLTGSHTAPSISAVQPTAPRTATTLQTAAGQAPGARVTESPKKRGRALFVVGGVVLVAGAATATTLVLTRHEPPAKHAKAPHDAGSVATVTPDAPAPIDAPVIVSVPVDADLGPTETEMRDKVHKLAQSRDWYTVLQVADLDHADPAIAADVAAAKKGYIAQVGAQIDVALKQGNCAHAKDLADKADKLVTDDTTLTAKAKTCVAHVEPPPPTIEAAKDELAKGQFVAALDTAERLLKTDPNNAAALRIAADAACDAKAVDKAKLYIGKLVGPDRKRAMDTCAHAGVTLESLEQQQLEDAEHDAMLGDYDNALQKAQHVLIGDMTNVAALKVAATSACHLRRAAVARRFINRLPPANRPAMEQICAAQGVFLDGPPRRPKP
jgi:serine/threonine-protein kinase